MQKRLGWEGVRAADAPSEEVNIQYHAERDGSKFDLKNEITSHFKWGHPLSDGLPLELVYGFLTSERMIMNF